MNKNAQSFRRAIALILALITMLCSFTAFAEDTGKVTAKVILRKSADKESKALQTIPEDEEIEVLDTSGKWYKVRYGKYTGYIMKKYVTVSKSSVVSNKSAIAKLGDAPGPLEIGATGSDVKKLQQALKILGYYDGRIDGDYGDATTLAVSELQDAQGLEPDGVAGKKTITAIFGSVGKSASKTTTTTTNKTTKTSTTKTLTTVKKTYTTEVLDWFDDEVTKVIPKNAKITIKDVKTGKTFEAVRWSGTNHLDAEPASDDDTKTMKAIYGGSWSWRRRAILVMYNGHVYAASMNGMPHGTSTIDNDFEGHFCIHFKNSKTHGTKKVDPDHQNAVAVAAKATW